MYTIHPTKTQLEVPRRCIVHGNDRPSTARGQLGLVLPHKWQWGLQSPLPGHLEDDCGMYWDY